MKKSLLLVSAMLCVCFSAAAQDDSGVDRPDKMVRKKFFNISYVADKIKPTDGSLDLGDIMDETSGIVDGKNEGLKNNWGLSLTRGRTYMLHKKPIARLLSIGLDVSFCDLTYSNYTMEGMDLDDGSEGYDETYGSSESVDMHKAEYAFLVGPSITITPGKSLTVAAYARYAPSFSCIYVDDSFYGNYATFFNVGASLTWKKIGVGIEARMGSCKYKNFAGGDDFMASKLKTSGFRAFLQFRW